jgi:hypothetical protein
VSVFGHHAGPQRSSIPASRWSTQSAFRMRERQPSVARPCVAVALLELVGGHDDYVNESLVMRPSPSASVARRQMSGLV